MQDADFPSTHSSNAPVVLTAEEIFLFIHGGSPANDRPREELESMSVEELVELAKRAERNHLTREKIAVLEAQLRDPNSWINRAFKMMDERNDYALKDLDWVKAIGNLLRKESGRPHYHPEKSLRRGDPQVAVERETIVGYIRNATEHNRLPTEAAERILAEAGESLHWSDSVPDRLIMSEPIAPVRGSPTERRKYLATFYYVLAELMAEQNTKMREQLAKDYPTLSDELQNLLTELNGPGGPGNSPG